MAQRRLNETLAQLQQLTATHSTTRHDWFWLLRTGLVSRSTASITQGGFILPTVTLLLLMMSLILGMLIFRTANRSQQVIGQRQQREVYNAATPAIERAKIKLDYLFTRESIPVLPSDNDIATALASNTYRFPGEVALDINGDGNNTNDATWTFLFDGNGIPNDGPNNDGKEARAFYSMFYRTRDSQGTPAPGDDTVISSSDVQKARDSIVRNGPINLTAVNGNPNCPDPGRSPYEGWQQVTGSQLRKAIQVFAYAQGANGTRATLEMQQDKAANLGNRWGAWFRQDMEVFPGPAFRWNGAMNTTGVYMFGGDQVRLYPISSPSSCVFTSDGSVIDIGDYNTNLPPGKLPNPDLNRGLVYQGQFMAGSMRDANTTGSVRVYPFSQTPNNGTFWTIDAGNDSVDGVNPQDVATDPVRLLTEGALQARNLANITNVNIRNAAWANRPWNRDVNPAEGRVKNQFQPTPFVDDTYRADNRWGPKPVYSEAAGLRIPTGINVADPSQNIIAAGPAINLLTPDNTEDSPTLLKNLRRLEVPSLGTTTDEEGFGFDGYWERRARSQGVRVIVGQRLELGNANGWVTEADANLDGVPDLDFNNNNFVDYDPLYPPAGNATGLAATAGGMEARRHEQRQMRTLRTNLAAVQSTAVYHYLLGSTTRVPNVDDDRDENVPYQVDGRGRYPAACLASTAHGGTDQVRLASRTFTAAPGGGTNPDTNFLAGMGTNGWEFAPLFHNGAVPTAASVGVAEGLFKTAINTPNSALRIALSNLAYFSGDLAGAFPAFQDTADGDNANDAANNALFRPGAGQRDATLGPVVHPYPIKTMWGDFSNLRRVINYLDQPGQFLNDYEKLSLADQTTLQTASCTVGLLAYNLDNLRSYGRTAAGAYGDNALSSAGGDLDRLANNTNGALLRFNAATGQIRTNGTAPLNGQPPTDTGGTTTNATDFRVFGVDNAGNVTGEVYRANNTRVQLFNPTAPAQALPVEVLIQALPPNVQAIARRIHLKEQVERDRRFGFRPTPTTTATDFNQGVGTYVYSLRYGNFNFGGVNRTDLPADNPANPAALTSTVVNLSAADRDDDISLGCDFSAATGNNFFGYGDPALEAPSDRAAAETRFLRLAVSLCPRGPKYPSLFYLFPVANHAHDGEIAATADPNVPASIARLIGDSDGDGLNTTAADPTFNRQPNTEPYTSDNLRVVTDRINPATNQVDFHNRYAFTRTANGGTPAGTNYNATDNVFRVVGDANNDGIDNGALNPTGTENGISGLALVPRIRANWILQSTTTNPDPAQTDRLTTNLIVDETGGAPVQVYTPLLDKVFFNGREHMAVRSMDFDLNMLRSQRVNGINGLGQTTSDFWLPIPQLIPANLGNSRTGALIFAFREDAVREDAIARPRRTPDVTLNVWLNNWRDFANQTFPAGYLMNAIGAITGGPTLDNAQRATDPPVHPENGISPKPADFYADPDRRPHGFRLNNGDDLRRNDNGAEVLFHVDGTTGDTRGMSFITDNALYVKGNFNRHLAPNGNEIQEFTQILTDDWNNFFTRNTLDNRFTRAVLDGTTTEADSWRATELIADGVTLVSDSFTDGWLTQGYELVNGTRPNAADNSFRSMNLPGNPNDPRDLNWVREDGSVVRGIDGGGGNNQTVDAAIPVKFSFRGFPIFCAIGVAPNLYAQANPQTANIPATGVQSIPLASGQSCAASGGVEREYGLTSNQEAYRAFNHNRGPNLINPLDPATAGTTTFNMIMVSGSPPSRAGQSYGGLHNYPRFLERWNTVRIAGSLLQLNFSTSATGPFDHDSWEPGANPNPAQELISYYGAPNRRWGYDVGLQYVQAAPVSLRFAARTNVRSEFYRELPVDDPYIVALRCAAQDQPGAPPDPSLPAASCPP